MIFSMIAYLFLLLKLLAASVEDLYIQVALAILKGIACLILYAAADGCKI